MLIIRASYRARGLRKTKVRFALAIGALTHPPAGIGEVRPYQTTDFGASQTTVRTRKRFIACQMYVSIALNSLSVQTDPPALAVLFAQMHGPLPPRQKR